MFKPWQQSVWHCPTQLQVYTQYRFILGTKTVIIVRIPVLYFSIFSTLANTYWSVAHDMICAHCPDLFSCGTPIRFTYNRTLYMYGCFNSYSASHGNWCTATLWNRIMTAQCEGMEEVGSARYEPALLPPCPSIRVLSYSNCQEIHSRQQTGLAV